MNRCIAGIGDQFFEPCQFLFGDVAICSGLKPSKGDIHDPDALKCANSIVQRLTHAADLAVQSLSKDDPECEFVDLLDGAGACDGIKYRHTGSHFLEKFGCDLFIDAHDIFLFMIIACAENLIDNIAVVGQQNKTFRILVETSDGEDPFFIADEIDDIVGIATVGRTDNTLRFVKGNEDQILVLRYELAFEGYLLTGLNPAAHQRFFAIDGNKPRFNRCVCLTP